VASSRVIGRFARELSKRHEKLFFEKYGLGFQATKELIEDDERMSPYFTTVSLVPRGNFATCGSIDIVTRGSARVGDNHVEDLEKRLHKIERKLGGGITMRLYEVFVVDTKKLVVLSQQTVFGEDESDAMSDVSLTDEQKALKKRQRIAILAREIGEFEPFAVVHVETEED
jgi:hypothetical protein